MSKTAHTRGPWSLQPQESYDGRATYRFYRVFDDNLNAICCEEYGAHNDGGFANMRLIAASPDMLEALEQYLPILEALEKTAAWDVYAKGTGIASANRYRAAIARAKGGA